MKALTKLIKAQKRLSMYLLAASAVLGMANCAQAQTASEVAANDLQRLEGEVKALQRQLGILKGRTAAQVKKEVRAQVAAAASQQNGVMVADVEGVYRGPLVLTSPTLGVQRSFGDMSNLLVSMPAINGDLVMLRQRAKIDSYLKEHKLATPAQPVIMLSGGVEVEGSYERGYDRGGSSDINLSMVELDVMAEVGPWTSAMAVFTYDSSGDKGGARVDNSRLRVDKAYITLGNLERLPFYLTAGQMIVPFGSYSGCRLTDALTKVVGRAKDRAVVAGYAKDNWELQIFGQAGELHYKSGANALHHFGANVGYRNQIGDWKFGLGASYTGAMAESRGIMLNAFKATRDQRSGSNTLNKKVRGANVRGRIGYKNLSLLAEYVGAINRFDKRDLKFNNEAAKPRATEFEVAYDCKICGKPATFAAGWGQSFDALALDVPRASYFAGYSVTILKNTVLGLEYRHDINYKVGTTAQGSGSLKQIAVDAKHSRHQNTYTVNLGVYF